MPTDATTFTYTTSALATPAPPAAAAAPTVDLGSATLAKDGSLTISVRSTTAAPFDLAAALPLAGTRAQISASGRAKLVIHKAGTAKGGLCAPALRACG